MLSTKTKIILNGRQPDFSAKTAFFPNSMSSKAHKMTGLKIRIHPLSVVANMIICEKQKAE